MAEAAIEGFRLSPPQRQLWHRAQGGVTPASATLRLDGGLDTAALERALALCMARHEILRTAYPLPPGLDEPLQAIDDSYTARLEPQESAQPDPRGLEAVLVSLGAHRHQLRLRLPGLSSDVRGFANLARELAGCYAEALGAAAGEAEAPQYADLAEALGELLEIEENAPGRRFWEERARSTTAAPRLPRQLGTGSPRGGVRVPVGLPAHLGTPEREVLLAAWIALVAQLCDEREITLGVGFDGRAYEEMAAVPGLFAHSLPIRSHPAPETSFERLCAQLRVELGEAARWQDCFAPPAGAPASVFGFDFETLDEPASGGGVRFTLERWQTPAEPFQVRLSVVRQGRQLGAELIADPVGLATAELTTAELVQLGRRLGLALEQLLAHPDRPLGELELLLPAERQQLVLEHNDTATAAPGVLAVHCLVAEQARRWPERPAVVGAGVELCYAELVTRSARLARRLRRCGVGPETLVGVFLERSAELVVALLAVLEAGGAYVPLDPGYPAERLRTMREDAGLELVLDAAWLARENGEPTDGSSAPLPPADPERLAYVLYTSGSTGRPKGVMIEHRAVVSYLLWARGAYEIATGAGAPLASSAGFDLSVTSLWGPLVSGRTVFLVPETGGVEALAAEIATRRELSLVKLTPSHLEAIGEMLAQNPAEPGRPGVLVVGGEALRAESFAVWGRHTRMVNEYGPTEASVGCCVFTLAAGIPTDGPVPIGRPITNARLYLTNPRLRLVPLGGSGEIAIAGAGLARGYRGRPRESAARFVPEPWSGEHGARAYLSGDLARRRADGVLEYLGRRDHQLKIRGFRIEPGEIEAVLAAHPAVREAVVVARAAPVPAGGPARQELVAYWVPAGPDPGPDALERHVRARLAEPMVPALFVRLDALPLSVHGKLDRAALPAPVRVGTPGPHRAPHNETEQRLARVWAELLRLERVGLDDNFFRLGGDSIIGLQMVARAARAGLRIGAADLFHHQTLGELAAVAQPLAPTSPETHDDTAGAALAPIQHAFFELEPPRPAHYNQAVLLATREPLEPAALERALAQLLAHHPALRSRFRRGPDGWEQAIAAAQPAASPTVALGRLAPAAARAALERAAARLQTSLDLEAGPLGRLAFFDLGGDRDRGRGGRLLWIVHHLAVDGVSWRILLEDLEAAYRAAARHTAAVLPAPSASYRRWCAALAELAASPELHAELPFWRAQLAGAEPLPIDGPAPAAPDLAGAALRVRRGLDPETTRALVREANAAYRTRIDELLLSALALALRAWTGSPRLLVELEGHGRDALAEVELERTVGWCTTLYPLRLELPAPSPEAAIPRVKERLRAVPRRGLGHGLLRYLAPAALRAELAGLGSAEIVFNYLGQLDLALGADTAFAAAPETLGALSDPRQPRRHRLEVVTWVAGGRLEVEIAYAPAKNLETTIATLAERFCAALGEIVALCAAPGAGAATPADFPLARLDAATLERLLGDAREVADLYPLTPLQEGLLFHSLHEEAGSDAYFQQLGCTLRGALDTGAFHRAWGALVARHATLRTAFLWRDLDQPLQQVLAEVELPWRELDLGAQSAAEQRASLDRLAREERRSGFDPARAPLLRLTLARLARGAHRFVWSFHHLLLDGWSMPILLGELFALYGAEQRGETPSLPPSVPFRDYAAWLASLDPAADETFWRRRLRGFSAPTPLPGDRSLGAGELTGRQSALPAELAAQLAAFARRHALTPSTVAQGVWALQLARYAGREEVVFGVVSSGRSAPVAGIERMVGMLINTLPTRIEIPRAGGAPAWLHALQEQQGQALAHEHSPLVKVQGWSEVPRGTPLFESLLAFENYPADAALTAGLPGGLEAGEVDFVERTHYPLAVTLAPPSAPGAPMPFKLLWDGARFDLPTIVRIAGHFASLLAALIATPERCPCELPMLGAAERHQLLHEWNDTAPAAPGAEELLHRRFEHQARRSPEAIAVVAGEHRLSYAALDARAERLARRLRRLGAGPEVPVAIFAPRDQELVVGILGILKSGGFYIPLDPSYPRRRLETMLETSFETVLESPRTGLVVLAETLRELLPATSARTLALGPTADDATATEINTSTDGAAGEPTRGHTAPVAANLAYTLFTSGSTGRPKGVAITHANVAALLRWAAEVFPAAELEGVLASTSVCFDLSVFELFVPLCSGGKVILAEHALALPQLPARAEVRLINTVPSAIAELAASGGVPAATRTLNLAGEALRRALVDRLYQIPTIARVLDLYGPSEDTVYSTWAPAARDRAEEPAIGRPIGAGRALVIGAGWRLSALGVSGELALGGAGLARGYFCRPGLSAERFVPDPWSERPGERLYRTGDRARTRPGGALEYLGRADHQVKIRGFRIELGEIEVALERHPGVLQAALVAPEQSAGGRRLCAFYTPAAEPPPSPAELREHLRALLPEHMVPAHLIALDTLPLGASGKLDRAALEHRAQESRACVRDRPSGGATAPRTATENALAEVWRAVLKLERVGLDDDFFELGGDSILALRVVSGARAAGLAITPRQIFERPTLAQLAAVAAPIGATAEQGRVRGPAPLTPAQRWFFELEPARPEHFNQALRLETPAGLDTGLLARALAALVEHHDALRLRFAPSPAGWRQWHAEPGPAPPLTRLDLSGLEARDHGAAIAAAAELCQRSLDLGRGPLLRFVWLDLGPRPGRLLAIVHHLAVDGVSWRILLEDLETAWRAFAAGHAAPGLPAKTTSFQRWAQALEHHARSPELRRELELWCRMLAHPAAALPRDAVRPAATDPERANRVGNARSVSASLAAERTHELLRRAPEAYHTRSDELLLAALALTLCEWTGEPAALVAVESHGREEIAPDLDLSRTVGWLTAFYPVRLEPGSAARPGAVIRAIKEQLRAIPRRGIGHGLLRYLSDDAAIAARLAALPRPELSFNYLGQLDAALAGDGLLRPAAESAGRSVDPRLPRAWALSVEAAVQGGRLGFEWVYCPELHTAATVERLAARLVVMLETLIDHCLDPAAGGYTPSDFPLARLDPRTLDRLVGAERNVEAIYPLAPMQQGMLFHALAAPETGFYFEQLCCTLVGDLDLAAFERACRGVVERHAALRTAFAWEGLEEPLQIVHRRVELPFAVEDWSALPAQERARRAEEQLAADRRRGFDLARAPLLRVRLERRSTHETGLVWSFHHTLFDGWSFLPLLRDLFALYEAERRGTRAELAPAAPYQDFIAWLGRRDLAAAEAFWRAELAGLDTPPRLAPDHPERLGKTRASAVRARVLRLGGAETAHAAAWAQGRRLTLNTLLLGAWALALARSCGESEVLFGTVVAGRPPELPGIDMTVGLFINTLPLRVCVGGEVVGWLEQLQRRQLALHEHGHAPLARTLGWGGLPVGPAPFDSVLIFENYPVEAGLAESRGSLEVRDFRLAERTTFALTTIVNPGVRLELRIDFDPRFDPTTVERLLRHARNLLLGLVTSPEQALARLPMLAPAERHQLRFELADAAPAAPETTLDALFAARAAATPDAVAVLWGEQATSYGELHRRAEALAARLATLGVGPEVPVGLCLERSSELVTAILGVLAAGGGYVPLDPAYPPERLAWIMADAGLEVLLTSAASAGALPARRAGRAKVIELDPATAPASAAGSPTRAAHTAANLAYVIYTSGSTGRPKGVQISHGDVARLLGSTRPWLGFGADDVWTLFHSYAFDFSVWELWGALAHGGRLVVVPAAVGRSPEQLWGLLARERVRVLNQTPSAFRPLVETDATAAGRLDLRLVIFGGEAVDLASLRPWWARYGERGPRLVNMYGITETTVHVTYRPLAAADLDPPQSSPIGVPIPDQSVHLLDRAGELVPLGVAGEIHVGGRGLARGYLARPALTAERFIPDPFAATPGARLYRSGDLARRRQRGELGYEGRADQQLKIRGYRIEPGEIEAALTAHPGVERALVAARGGAGERRLVGYFVPRAVGTPDALATAPSAAELRTHLEARLPAFMVPAFFVALAALPTLPSGKLDHRALPDPEPPTTTGGESAAHGQIETTLAEIFAQVLRQERVGIDEHFFELGGDSILAIEIASRARRAGLRFDPNDLFEHPTIARLAAVVETAPAFALAQTPVLGAAPLLPIQRWFFEHQPGIPRHWNQALMLAVDTALALPRLNTALACLLEHHDALRLRFHRGDAGWSQEHAAPGAPAPCHGIDLSRLAARDIAPALERASAALQASLDLERGPLVRLAWLRLAPGAGERLLWLAHHLVVDGVSWRLLLEDLEALYRQLEAGTPPRLPAKTTAFQDWSRRLEQLAGSAEAQTELAFWHQPTRAQIPPLPRDLPTPGAGTYAEAETVTVALDPAETRLLLRTLPVVYGTQVNDALLASLVRALAPWTGSPRQLLDLESHGREALFADVDLSRTVGWLTAIYPLTLDVAGLATPAEALRAVAAQLARVPRRGLGWGLLRYLAGGETSRTLAALPPAELGFNYLGQLDTALAASAVFRAAPESSGPTVDPRAPRPYLLEINARVAGERFEALFTYGTRQHRRATIERLAASFLAELRALLASSQTPAEPTRAASFPLAALDAEELDALAALLETLDD